MTPSEAREWYMLLFTASKKIDSIVVTVFIIFLLILVFIQKSKRIKKKPFTAFANLVGRAVNHDILEEVHGIKHEVGEVKTEVREIKKCNEIKEVEDTRRDIFAFANACRNGTLHTRSHWEDMIRRMDMYEEYIESHDVKNGVFKGEDRYLRETFQKRLDKNDFLPETKGE